jgi:adenine phosphoribosyltransferase
MSEQIRSKVRDVPDFPKKGIIFKDITPVLGDKDAFKKAIDIMAARYEGKGIDQVVGIESRGFIFGAPLAYKLGAGFTPVRKKGKLPADTVGVTYELEYGTDTLEIHKDALGPGHRVVIVDDLLATGGTAEAVTRLVAQLGAEVVEIAFMIELEFLKGREKLPDVPIYSLLKY